MATIALTTPYNLKNATLAIAADDFTAAVSQVQFTPATTASTWRGIGGNVLKEQAVAEWSVTVGLAQDLDPTGLLRYLLENEGLKKSVAFVPLAGGPAVNAMLIIAPADIGGSAGADLASSSVTLSIIGKPTFADASAVPVVTGASPSGATATSLVTITGKSFTGATAVKFGATAATAFTFLSSSTIVASVPAGAAGTAAITVTTPAGISTTFAYTRGA
ncbi:MAG: IPT/TIG domain-containing protein [Cellulomonas sp.]